MMPPGVWEPKRVVRACPSGMQAEIRVGGRAQVERSTKPRIERESCNLSQRSPSKAHEDEAMARHSRNLADDGVAAWVAAHGTQSFPAESILTKEMLLAIGARYEAEIEEDRLADGPYR